MQNNTIPRCLNGFWREPSACSGIFHRFLGMFLYKVVEHVSWTQGIGGLDDGAARSPTLLHIVCAILGERRRLRLAVFDVYEVGEANPGIVFNFGSADMF